MDEQTLTIQKSAIKQLLLILGSAGFVVIGYFMIFGGLETSRHSPFFIKLFGVIGIMFFGPIGILMIIEFFRFRPALKLSNKGIQNYSHAGGGYIIEWDNIKTMRIKTISKKKFIVLDLYDPNKVYSQVNRFTKWWMKLNEKQYGSPTFIPSVLIKTKLEDLMKQIREFNKHLKNKDV